MYIDFIYGALLKMKEYNAHNHLEAYRKLMELFPIGNRFIFIINYKYIPLIFELLKDHLNQ